MILGIQCHQVFIKLAQLQHLPPDAGVVEFFVGIADCNGDPGFLGANQGVSTIAHNPAMGCTGGNRGDVERGDIVQIQHTGVHFAHQTAAVVALDGCGVQGEGVHLDEMTVILRKTHDAAGAAMMIAVEIAGNIAVRDLQMGDAAPQLAHHAAEIGNIGAGGAALHGAARQGDVGISAAADSANEAAQTVGCGAGGEGSPGVYKGEAGVAGTTGLVSVGDKAAHNGKALVADGEVRANIGCGEGGVRCCGPIVAHQAAAAAAVIAGEGDISQQRFTRIGQGESCAVVQLTKQAAAVVTQQL